MSIKFIVHTIGSNPDSVGNCYFLTRIVSAATGKSAVFFEDQGNSLATLRLWLDWSEISYSEPAMIGIRRFNAMTADRHHHQQSTPAIIKELNA